MLVMPSTRPGFTKQNNTLIPDSDDVFDGVSLFAPTVTGFASHAVLGTTNRAVCAINDKGEGRKLSQGFCEVMSLSFRQAEFSFESNFKDGCKAMSPNTSLWLAHPKEECHDVEGRVSLEPEENEKEFVTRVAQRGIAPSPKRALPTSARSEHRSRLLGSQPCFVKCR